MIGLAIGSLSLLGFAGLMMDTHLRHWRLVKGNNDYSERQIRFARNQFRRRMQASGLIGVCGGLIGIWPLVPRTPLWMTIYLALLVASTLWIMLMGVFDAWASSMYYRQTRLEQIAKQARLATEIQKAKLKTRETQK